MSRWFRHYAGTMSDPKFGGAARVCKRSRAEVLFVWGCLLESCAEYNSDVYSFDADAMADLLDIEAADAQSIHDALVQKGLLEGGKIVSWGRRQFTSDDSTKRVRAHRERQKTATIEAGNADETLPKRDVTPPYTETDTEGRTEAEAPVLRRAKAPKQARSTRLCPESWNPSQADLGVGASEGFTPGEIERELAKFRDHEFKTAHSRWSKTFRNWIRTAAERRRHEPNHRISPGHPQPDARRANTERRRDAWLDVVAERDGRPLGEDGDGSGGGGPDRDGGQNPRLAAPGDQCGDRDGDRGPGPAFPRLALQRG